MLLCGNSSGCESPALTMPKVGLPTIAPGQGEPAHHSASRRWEPFLHFFCTKLHHFLHLADRKCLICNGPVAGIAPPVVQPELTVTVVPEPATFSLRLTGVAALSLCRWARRFRQNPHHYLLPPASARGSSTCPRRLRE